MRRLPCLVVALLVCLSCGTARAEYTAVTAADPAVPLPELELMLLPLTQAELEVEADAWMALLQEKVRRISEVEIASRYKKQELSKAKQAADAAKEAQEKKQKAQEAVEEAQTAGDEKSAEKAAKADEAARQAEQEAAEAAEAAAAAEQKVKRNGTAKDAVEAAEQTVAAKSGDAPAGEDAELEAKAEVRTQLLDQLTELQSERTALIDRVDVVLTELAEKGGDPTEHRRYVKAVSGLRVDVSDTSAALTTIVGWLTSPEGGIRWATNIGQFLAILVAFWLASLILGKATAKAAARNRRISQLMRDFLVTSVKRVILIVGLIVAVTALEVNITPLVAAIGAAGLVLGLALQGTLGNFASGIMILLYRPFDVGDVVEVGGVSGKVQSLNLVSTTLKTFDNKIQILPNNTVWGDIITNVTGSDQRRVDMVFGISYDSDMAEAQTILERLVEEHPLTLDEPQPTIKVHELADSSVNFICRPWSKTEDYWTVYWDVTRAVKEEFDKAGISIPFPQRDIHVYNAAGSPEPPTTEVLSGTRERVH